MDFINIDHVKKLLQKNLLEDIENVQKNVSGIVRKTCSLKQKDLYNLLTLQKTVYRDILVERDIPQDCGSGKPIALR